MFERLRWEVEMTALTSAVQRSITLGTACGLSKEAAALGVLIAAVTYMRTEGIGDEDALIREACRAVPGAEQVPGTGLILA